MPAIDQGPSELPQDNDRNLSETRESARPGPDGEATLDRTVIDNLNSVVLLLDDQLRVLMCNVRFHHLFGIPEASVKGMTIAEVFHDEPLGLLVLQAVSTYDSVNEIEYAITVPGEEERRFLISVSRLDEAPPARALVILDEITEWRQRQVQVMEASRLVSIGELVAGAAHEINNPLAAVMGFSQLVLRRDLEPEVRTDVERILSEATRASQIVANLQSFARRGEPRGERFDLAEIVLRVLDLRTYELQLDNIEVVTDFKIASATMLGDQQQIEQVVLNITANAAHFMKEANGGGTLTVSLEGEGPNVRLRIADDGPGISPDHLPLVFDPFFTTKEVGTGTGLGLSVCYGIITGHGGAISVDSKPGEGAAFTIELEAETTAISRTTASPESPEVVEQRVLVVDDEPAVVDLVSRILSDFGFSVTTASNGQDVINQMELDSFDIVILDYRMPAVGGVQLFDHIESISPDLATKVLFMTGDSYGPAVEDTVRRSGNPVLNKPFSLEDLLTGVMRVAERRTELERA